MPSLWTLGGVLMIIATLSLLALALDSVFRHGGEGILIGIGLGAMTIVPALAAVACLGGPWALSIEVASWYAAALVTALLIFSLVLLFRQEEGGAICIGIAFVMGAGLWAIAPGYIAAQREREAKTVSASTSPQSDKDTRQTAQ